jgi:hypothetical protein
MSKFKTYWQKGTKQKVIILIIAFLLLFILFISRDSIQPLLLGIRKYLFIGMVFFLILFIGLQLVRNSLSWRKMAWTILTLALVGGLWFILFPIGIYTYMETYAVFKNIKLTEIENLPLTRNERIQPWNNIITMAYESIAETEEVSPPQLVRIDGENRWTMAIQPSKNYYVQRITDNTEEIFSVPSTQTFPRFSEENRISEIFSVGESLVWSRNSYNAVVQKFNLWQMFSLEPDELFYMKNDEGRWVQVISLIEWKGFFFPYPTYGGVMVLQAGDHGFNDYVEKLLWGKGEYIAPDKMKNYPYLQGQNVLSAKISRIQAESLKFLAGFSDPLPWNKKSAVKIPELEDDQNQQPFVTDFDFENVAETYKGLYHWFGLEPIGAERTSLSISVMIPADGTNAIYYYSHGKRKEGYAGVSAMPAKVVESKKEYDWTANRPVEFRPYIKDILGKRRLFMLSTVVANRKVLDRDTKKKISQFDGAATPDLALVDVQYKDVIWVDAKKPSTWNETIINQMAESWGVKINKKESNPEFPTNLK